MTRMMSVPSTTQGQGHFSSVPKIQMPRSQFDRSYGYKTTFDAGQLIPFFVQDILPGDTVNLSTTAFARLATPLTPFMDNLWLDTQYFFVPWRLVWDNFQKMMGEQVNPGDSVSYLTPVITVPAGGFLANTIFDYFGLPIAKAGMPAPAALRLRAMNLIWNQWYRDENLQNSVTVNKGDGPDADTLYTILKRGKRHDYFTSCLPSPQKGPAVSLPLGTSAPVNLIARPGNTNPTLLRNASTGASTPSLAAIGTLASPSGALSNGSGVAQVIDPNGTLITDLTAATAATINALRQAFQIQSVYEIDARGGTRYTEIIKAHFGVVSDDARLQRAEYLGGGTSPVVIDPIAQTSAIASQPTPQGTLTAIGTTVIRGHGFTKSFLEHGTVIGFISARADLNYQQGLERHWTKSSRFDYYLPAMSQIGEQVVFNYEIYCQGTAGGAADLNAFGYQERWAEERYSPSMVTGELRSSFAQTLDMWHLAENFTSLPTLSSAFIQSNPPISRVIAVPTAPHFILDCHHKFLHARVMPTYSVPYSMNRF